ncbi:unnamed protein product [Leuciscus chuanchicus]
MTGLAASLNSPCDVGGKKWHVFKRLSSLRSGTAIRGTVSLIREECVGEMYNLASLHIACASLTGNIVEPGVYKMYEQPHRLSPEFGILMVWQSKPQTITIVLSAWNRNTIMREGYLSGHLI